WADPRHSWAADPRHSWADPRHSWADPLHSWADPSHSWADPRHSFSSKGAAGGIEYISAHGELLEYLFFGAAEDQSSQKVWSAHPYHRRKSHADQTTSSCLAVIHSRLLEDQAPTILTGPVSSPVSPPRTRLFHIRSMEWIPFTARERGHA
ncbi:hypothetical protein PENTCL1PPCAC_9687, partial [Pristionchus entomophagus]